LTYNKTDSLVESRDTISFFKGKPSWCQETLKEAENLSSIQGLFFKESINKLNLVIDSESSTYEMWEDIVIEK
jgi:hypothetical protein